MNQTTYSYTEFAAQQRHEEGAGLGIKARVDAAVYTILDETHRIAVRQRNALDARSRRDAREQFLARMAAV